MPTIEPTTKRGAELAREVLDTIEYVEARFGDAETYLDLEEQVREGPAWEQGTWGQVWLDDLPSGVDVEAVPSEAWEHNDLNSYYGSTLISVSGGLSCGTAMCFAGHTVNMAGDRLVVSIDQRVVKTLRGGAARKNLKRWLNKLRRRDDLPVQYLDGQSGNQVVQVITPEGKVTTIAQRAQELLGLTDNEADTLFSGGNDLSELRRYVQRMEENRHVTNGRKKK